MFEKRLSLSHEAHGDDLTNLRAKYPAVFTALIRGYPRTAVEHARAIDSTAVVFGQPIIVNHILFLMVATAHQRIHLFLSISTNPLSCGFSGKTKWKTLGEVCKAALIGPAIILKKLLEPSLTDGLNDEEALTAAKASGVFPETDSGNTVLRSARKVKAILPDYLLTEESWKPIIRQIQKDIDPLSRLTNKSLQEDGLTKISFTRWRFGVSTTEAAVIIAMNLMRARSRIEACVEAILNGRQPPIALADPNGGLLSNNHLARITEALRVECRSDKDASSSMSAEENHNSKGLVKDTKSKIESADYNKAFTELLLDPSFYFRRKFRE